MEERLQKILARAGLGSRRACEELIRQGRVAVDGQLAQIGQKADPDHDRITVDGKPVRVKRSRTYVALHKPRGVLSDEGGGSGRLSTVRDLVPLPGRLFPVGRLDLRSEGLILLTDDGGLAHRLTHPRFGHDKEYRALVDGVPEDVWNFHVGGYQVCYKWLYDRRGKRGEPGRTLTEEDITHYQRIVVALQETMRLMEEIDEVIDGQGGWPIE